MVSPASRWIPALNRNIKAFVYEFEKNSQLSLVIPNGKIQSEDVSVVGRFRLSNISPEFSTNHFNVDFQIENAEILAKNVKIQILMDQDLGFGLAHVKLDVQCAAISVQAMTSQKLFAVLDGNLKVKNINTDLRNESLKTNLVGCTAVTGLDQAIQEKILKYIQAQIINEQLHQFLSDEISMQLTKKLNELASSILSDVENLQPLKYSIDEKLNLWITPTKSPFNTDEMAGISDSKVTALLIKKEFLEKLILQRVNQEFEKKPLYSNLNSGLQKLTCSRWSQFLTWPALMSLPKCFNLEIDSKLEEVKLLDPTTMNFKFSLKSMASAVNQKKNIAVFNTTSHVTFSTMVSEITALKAKHFPDFLSWSGGSSRISTGIIQSVLQTGLTQELQKLKLNETKIRLFNLFDVQKARLINAETLLIQLKEN